MKTSCWAATAAAILLMTAAATTASPAQESSELLKGRVVQWSDQAPTLEKRMEAARNDFRRSNRGDLYFTGYLFPSRSKTSHRTEGSRGPFEVVAEGGEVGFRGRDRSQSFETKDQAGPSGVLWLNSLSAPRRGILDVRLLDPDAVYEFKTIPVYWLGAIDAGSSCAFAEKEFESGAKKLQESLVFIISQHDTARAFDFLKRTALGGSFALDVRKAAVFWAGCRQDPQTVGLLKEVLRTAGQKELKEHAVFALSLSHNQEALRELIKIAKTDRDLEARKKAIFWLGQKASQESVKALKDVVESPDEDIEVKESAVFAVSQLPKDKAVPLLVSIAKENKSPSVRKKAIFWLGQTGDEKALQLFEEILLGKR